VKALVVYYSRTGTTKKVAEIIKGKLKCDIEEIITEANLSGLFGYIKCGYQAFAKKTPRIRKMAINLNDYDTIIIGTPVWAGNMSSPIRTFLIQEKDHCNKVAFFCTHSSPGCSNAFDDMSKLCGQEPLAILDLQTTAVVKDDYAGAIEEFVYEIIEKMD
jgi:flavodoxin